MDIQKELAPNWPKICVAANITGAIGTSLQNELQYRIRPLLPSGVGYYFDFNMGGMCEHVFYEIANQENKLVL